MNGARVIGAVVGATAAGLALSALMLAGERKTGKPSELADLKRAGTARVGLDSPPADQMPSVDEQAVIHGGHLALSTLAGLAYAATTDDDTPVVPSGIAFGLAFYGIAHWIVGPALGLKHPEWRSDAGTIGMHATNHVLFGLATAAAASVAGDA